MSVAIMLRPIKPGISIGGGQALKDFIEAIFPNHSFPFVIDKGQLPSLELATRLAPGNWKHCIATITDAVNKYNEIEIYLEY